MGFKLPRLTTDIDCGPIGYPGLLVTCWLNMTYTDYEPPDERDPGRPWDTPYYYGLARVIDTITVPAEFTDSGKQVVIDVRDSQVMYEVLTTEGFDQQIVLWAIDQYQSQRQDRMQAELKN
jgi:hypothetical protein